MRAAWTLSLAAIVALAALGRPTATAAAAPCVLEHRSMPHEPAVVVDPHTDPAPSPRTRSARCGDGPRLDVVNRGAPWLIGYDIPGHPDVDEFADPPPGLLACDQTLIDHVRWLVEEALHLHADGWRAAALAQFRRVIALAPEYGKLARTDEEIEELFMRLDRY